MDGNLQADENTGGLTISYNVIEGALQCKQNNPPPGAKDNMAGDKRANARACRVNQRIPRRIFR